MDKFVLVPRQLAEIVPTLLASCEAAFISFAMMNYGQKQYLRNFRVIWHVVCR